MWKSEATASSMNIWQRSGLYGLGEFFRISYEKSNTRLLVDRFGNAENHAEASLYGKLIKLLSAFFLWIGKFLKESLLFAVAEAIKRLYFRISKGSLIFGTINRASLHRWVLFLFAMYLPVEYILRDVLALAVISGIWEEVFIIGAMAVVIWRTCTGEGIKSFNRVSSVEVFLLLYICSMLFLAGLNHPSISIAIAGLRAQVEYTVWFYIIFRLVDDFEDAKALIIAFGCVVLLMSFHGIWQFIIAVPIPSSWTTSTESAIRTRVFSITGSPNIFGSLLVMAAPIPAAFIYYFKRPLYKFLAFCATGVMCLCDLFTFSRGSWIGIVLAVIIFSFFVDKRLIMVMFVGICGILAAVPSITNRLTFMLTPEYRMASSIGGRAVRWATARELLANSNKWLGFGLGRFGGAVAMNNQVIDTSDGFKYFYMDNYYLKTLTESGIIGLFAYILLLVVFLICGLKAVHQDKALLFCQCGE